LAKRSASLWPTKKGHQRNYQQANMTKTAKKFVPEIDRDRTRQRERERDIERASRERGIERE